MYYAASSEPAGFRAADVAPLLAQIAGWHTDTSMPCATPGTGQTTACVWSDVAELEVFQNGASTESWSREPIQGPLEQIEGGGYDELRTTVMKDPGVLLICSAQYFYG